MEAPLVQSCQQPRRSSRPSRKSPSTGRIASATTSVSPGRSRSTSATLGAKHAMGRLLTRCDSSAPLALRGAACTVNTTDVPGLTGPSEFAQSLQTDRHAGQHPARRRAQSSIVVTARDANGSAVSGSSSAWTSCWGRRLRHAVDHDGRRPGRRARTRHLYGAARAAAQLALGTCAASIRRALPGPAWRSWQRRSARRFSRRLAHADRRTFIWFRRRDYAAGGPDGAGRVVHVSRRRSDTRDSWSSSMPRRPARVAGRTIVQLRLELGRWRDGDRTAPVEDHDYPRRDPMRCTLTVIDDAGVRGSVDRY